MPIRAENRDRYPTDWPAIRSRILQRAQHRCEFCGVSNHALGGRLRDGSWLPANPIGESGLSLHWPAPGSVSWCGDREVSAELRIVRIVLTIAHLDHVPEHCDEANLRALCQRCHLRYDIKHHGETAYRTRRLGRAAADLFGDGACA